MDPSFQSRYRCPVWNTKQREKTSPEDCRPPCEPTGCKDLVLVDSRIEKGTGKENGAAKPTRRATCFPVMGGVKWRPGELGAWHAGNRLYRANSSSRFYELLKLSSVKKGPGAHLLLSMFKKAFRKEHQETDLQLQRQSPEGRACLETEQGSC